MKRLSGQIGYRNNDLQQYLIPFSQQEKQPLSREGNVSFQPLSIFQPINMVPQYAERGLVSQTRIANVKKYHNSLQIGGSLKSVFKTLKTRSSKGAATKVI